MRKIEQQPVGMRLSTLSTLLIAAGALGYSSVHAAAPSSGKKSPGGKDQLGQPKAPASVPQSPNIIIIMLDDAGYAQADTFGGEIHTPTLTRTGDRAPRAHPPPAPQPRPRARHRGCRRRPRR